MGSIRSHVVLRRLGGVVTSGSMRSRVVLRRLDGVVTRGRVILQAVSVVARGSVSCDIKLRCFSGVVLEDLSAGTGRCVSCVGMW
jgi:hypothetical protein